MKSITEYLINNHVKNKLSLFTKNMDVYKEMSYKKFVQYSEGYSRPIAANVVDIVKNLYGVSSLTKDIIIEFLNVHYPVFLDMKFTDKQITDKIHERLVDVNGDTRFASAENIIKYFKDALGVDEENTADRFPYWACPCLFNAFIKLVDEINNETV